MRRCGNTSFFSRSASVIDAGQFTLFVDCGRNDVRLMTAPYVGLDEFVGALESAGANRKCFDWRAPGREFIDDREIEVGVDGLRERARNRRRRHVQRVRSHTFRAQPRALLDAEAMLLVDDHEAEPREIHAVGQERMRADRKQRFTRREASFGRVARLAQP